MQMIKVIFWKLKHKFRFFQQIPWSESEIFKVQIS